MIKARMFILMLIVMFIIANVVQAQIPDTLWSKTYGGSDNDYGYDLKQTLDGGYIIAGSTASFGSGWWNIYLVKTDAMGDTVWTNFYSAEGPDIAYCVEQTNDNGYIVACEGFANLIKLDEFGDSVWTQNYGIIANAVHQTTDGGYIVGGSMNIEGFGCACLIRTDEFGNCIWQKPYIMGDVNPITKLLQTPDGGFIAAGPVYSEQSWWDYFLIKTNASGDTVWTRRYGAIIYPEEAYALQQTSDGGYIISGLYFWTVKTDANGDTLWTSYYGSGESACAFSIRETCDRGFIISGSLDPAGMRDDSQFYLVKIDSLGTIIWEQFYGTPGGWDYGQSVCITNDGGCAFAGWTNSFSAGDMDIWLIKLESMADLYGYLPGDVNMYGGAWPPAVTGPDITYLVNYFRGLPTSYPCFFDGFWSSADANGDCIVIGGDVTKLVNVFLGISSIGYCPSYPPMWLTPDDLPQEAPEGWSGCE